MTDCWTKLSRGWVRLKRRLPEIRWWPIRCRSAGCWAWGGARGMWSRWFLRILKIWETVRNGSVKLKCITKTHHRRTCRTRTNPFCTTPNSIAGIRRNWKCAPSEWASNRWTLPDPSRTSHYRIRIKFPSAIDFSRWASKPLAKSHLLDARKASTCRSD